MTEIRFVKVKVENKSDVDKYVKDAYGKEHVIYPHTTKVVLMVRRKQNDRSRLS